MIAELSTNEELNILNETKFNELKKTLMTLETKIENKNKILKGLEKAYEKMLLFKKERKSELVIIQDDKIVKIKL